MRARVVILLCLGSLVYAGQQVTGTPLRGCAEASQLAGRLQSLRDADWNITTFAVLQQLWPAQFVKLAPDTDSLTSYMHEGRVIESVCECGEVFDFGADNESAPGHLKRITIHYSAGLREEVVAAAKAFASASRLSAAEQKKVGTKAVQYFQWQTHQFRSESNLIEIHLLQRRNYWYLFFTFSRASQRDNEPREY
jgi:hypothetical protein